MTDQQVIATIRSENIKNSETALSYFYTSYYSMVESFVTRNNGTQDDAKDVFQEAIVAIYNNVKTDRYIQESKLSTYLFSISKNIWFKKLRKLGRVSSIEDNEYSQLASTEDIHHQIEYSEQQKLIGKLLHKIGQECSKLLKLFYFERMRMVKIADKMDFTSEQIAKNKKARCMKKLRALVLSSGSLKEQLRNSY